MVDLLRRIGVRLYNVLLRRIGVRLYNVLLRRIGVRRYSVKPPSTLMTAPLMKAASSEAKNT